MPPSETGADGKGYYSLPVIYDPKTKKYVVDSTEIVKYLDETYPDTPRLYPEGTGALQHAAGLLIVPPVLFPLLRLLLFPIHQLLNPKSQAYWRTTREAKFGKKLEEFDTEDDWKALESGLSTVKEILEQNGEGKDLLFTGSQVTQIDLQLAAILVFGKVVFGEESAPQRSDDELRALFAQFVSLDADLSRLPAGPQTGALR